MRARTFAIYWTGQATSYLGDAFAFVAMPLLILQATGSVTQMGIVTALQGGAQVVTGLFAGTVVDRVNRRWLMIGCDCGRLLLFSALAAAWLAGLHDRRLIYVVSAVTAALGNLFIVASMAAVPNIVERDALTTANSRLQSSQALAYVVGPVLAGLVAARVGAAWAVAFDALTFGASAATLASIRFRRDQAAGREVAPGLGRLAGLSLGVRFLFRDRTLAAITTILCALALLGSTGLAAGMIDLIIFHLRSELGRSETAVGACLTCAALGALVGAVLAPRLQRRFGLAACFLGGTGLQACGLFVAGVCGGTVATGLGAGLWAAGLTTRAVPTMAYRQAVTPDALMGRVSSAAWTLSFATAAVGSVAVSRVAASMGTRPVLTGVGLAIAAIALLGWLTPLREAQ